MTLEASKIKTPLLSKSDESCTEDSDETEDDLTVSDHVRVVIRCRPLQPEREEDSSTVLSVDTSRNTIEVSNLNAPPKKYHFCCVADAAKDQNFVFQQTGKPIVECALAGFNGAIVAYGQTGSGKTFTMQGTALTSTNGNVQSTGIIQSVCETIFTRIRDASNSKDVTKYSINASYLEIYNETLIDLLSGFDVPGKQIRSPSGSLASSPNQSKLTIREDSKGRISVVGLSHFEVDSPERCYSLLKAGGERRTVGATKMNIESSRSHAVFTLSITKRSVDKGIVRNSRLHLVDLAGSERQKGTGATGIRLKEAGGINKSLSALGNVINALSAREGSTTGGGTGFSTRIPSCRDSKLTFLLKDSLGGNAKLCLIATISPALSSIEETLSTLEFAKRCAAVRNEAVVNESLTEDVTELQREVRRLQKSLKHVQMSLSQAKAAEAELRMTCHPETGDRSSKGFSSTLTKRNHVRKDASTQVELMEDPQDCNSGNKEPGEQVRSTQTAERCSFANEQRFPSENEAPIDCGRSDGETCLKAELPKFQEDELQKIDKQVSEKENKSPEMVHQAVENKEKTSVKTDSGLSLNEMKDKWKEMIETNERLWDALTKREVELTELRESSTATIADGTNRRLRQELELMRVRAEHSPEVLILRHRVEAYESHFTTMPSSPVTPSKSSCVEQTKDSERNEASKRTVPSGGILKTKSMSKGLTGSASIGSSGWLRSGQNITQRLRSGGSKSGSPGHSSPVKSVSFADGVQPSSSAPGAISKCRMIQAAFKAADEARSENNGRHVTGDTDRRCDLKIDSSVQNLRRTVTRRKERLGSNQTQSDAEHVKKDSSKLNVHEMGSPNKWGVQKKSDSGHICSEQDNLDSKLHTPGPKGKNRARDSNCSKQNESREVRKEFDDNRRSVENESRPQDGFATDDSWIRARIKSPTDKRKTEINVKERTESEGKAKHQAGPVRSPEVARNLSRIRKRSQPADFGDRRDTVVGKKVDPSLCPDFGGGLSMLIDDLEKSVAESEEL